MGYDVLEDGDLGILIRRLRWDSSAIRFELALRSYQAEQAKHDHWETEPRVSAGRTGGGQWTTIGGPVGAVAGSARTASALGRITFSGPLVGREYDAAKNITYCLFRDLATGHVFPVPFPGRYCPNGYVNW